MSDIVKTKEQLLKENKELKAIIAKLENFQIGNLPSNKIEIDLNEKSGFIDKIINSSALSTWISDEKGTAIRVNPACLEFFGATEEEVVGKYNILKDRVIEEQGFMPEIKKVFEKGVIANIVIDYNFGAVDHVDIKNATHKIINSIFTPVLNNDREVTNVIVQSIDLTEIKMAEKKIRETEENLRNIFDISPSIICVVDYNTGYFTNCNLAVTRILGYSVEEFISKPLMEHVYPNDRLKTETEKAGQEGGKQVVDFENRYICKDGAYKWLSWQATVPDKRGLVYAVATDITERKQTEQLLKESEEKFRTLVTNNEEIIYIINKDGTFLLSEGKGLAKLGIQPGQVVGHSVFELYKDYPDMLYEMQKAFAGETITVENKVGGQYFRNWYTPRLNNKNEVIGLLGLSVNVTERKKVEERLLSEKKYSEELINALPGLFYQISSEGKFINWNKNFEDTSGYSSKEIRKMNPIDLFDGVDKEHITERIKNVFKYGESNAEAEFVSKDGKKTHCYFSGKKIMVDEIPVLIGMGLDVSSLKQAEEELTQSLQREQIQADIVRTAPIAIAFGYPDGKLENCNKAFSDLTGYSEEELKSINWNDVLTPPKWNSIEAEELRRLTPENNHIRYEKEYIHKTGRIIPIELVVTAKFDSKNNLIHFIGFIEDITEIKKHREHLEELVKERTTELEIKNKELDNAMKVFVGRELTIRDLQNKIKALKGRL